MMLYTPSDITAAVSAIVGTATLSLSAAKWNERRREKKFCVDVKLSHGAPAYWDGSVGPDLMLVEAMNPGSRPVVLTSSGILLPDGRTLISRSAFGGDDLPRELGVGKNCLKWMETIPVAEAVWHAGFRGTVKLIGFYGDALGKRHKSKPLELDIAMWQRIAVKQRGAQSRA